LWVAASAAMFRDMKIKGFTGCGKSIYFVILSEAKNLSSVVSERKYKKERFFASLRMTER